LPDAVQHFRIAHELGVVPPVGVGVGVVEFLLPFTGRSLEIYIYIHAYKSQRERERARDMDWKLEAQ